MKINFEKTTRPLLVAVFILFLCACLPAQTHQQKRVRWDWKRHRAEIINYAKKYPVSNIEPDLPRQSFADWFRAEVGQPAKFSWEINDCGEQSGTSADRGRDFPLCVEATAALGTDVSASVSVQFGTFRRGITPDKPVVRLISIGREDDFGRQPEKMSELSQRLRELMSK